MKQKIQEFVSVCVNVLLTFINKFYFLYCSGTDMQIVLVFITDRPIHCVSKNAPSLKRYN